MSFIASALPRLVPAVVLCLALGPDGNLCIGVGGDGSLTPPSITRYELSGGTLATVSSFSSSEVFPGSLAGLGLAAAAASGHHLRRHGIR